jgi:hypothetical protein
MNRFRAICFSTRLLVDFTKRGVFAGDRGCRAQHRHRSNRRHGNKAKRLDESHYDYLPSQPFPTEFLIDFSLGPQSRDLNIDIRRRCNGQELQCDLALGASSRLPPHPVFLAIFSTPQRYTRGSVHCTD